MKTSTSSLQTTRRLWLALRLPDLPAHALHLDINSPEPLVVNDKRRLCWMNSAAAAAGIQLDMDATTAQLLTGCVPHERDSSKEQLCLAQLAEGMYQFSPYIEIYCSKHEPQSGLLLEIASCLRLFGGAQSLCHKIEQFLMQLPAQRQITPALGLAHSQAAAWLLSFVNDPIDDNNGRADFIARLTRLPIGLLHDFPKQTDALEKTGFVSLGDIARHIETQTISSFKKRFGPAFADYLSDIFGIDQDFQQNSLFEKPVTHFKPGEFFTEQLQFDYPLHQIDQLQQPMETLLQRLAAYLQKRQLQTQHIEWTLSDIYRHHNVLHVYADSLQSQWQLLFTLSLIQLENRELPFEVDTLTLCCRDTLALQGRSYALDFEPGRKVNRQSFSITAAKLKARLGDASVYKLSYQDGYLPDDTNQHILLTQTCQQILPDIHLRAQRPSWLLDAPVAVELRNQNLYWRGRITLIAGPERIQGNWWREPSARDYFIGLRQDQQRLWLFWDLHKRQWFVQGFFS